MPEIDLRRQLLDRLESLKAAGVELLPRAELTFAPPGNPPPQPAVRSVPRLASTSTLDTMPKAKPVVIAVPEATVPPAARGGTPLDVLRAEIAACKKCPELFSTRTQTVFGVGPMHPELCFVGEAPGADEDACGEPFVGRAGQKLNDIIIACGFQRGEVYICNTLKCRPPNNATPTPIQCANCRPFFERQLDLVKPKWICCLGAVAAKNVLQSELGIGMLRGKVHHYRGIPVVCTYHPAYLLRNPAAKRDCWNDMQFLLKQMGREIPPFKKN